MSETRTGPGPGPKSAKAKTRSTPRSTGPGPEDSNSLPWPKPVLAGYAGRLPHRLHRPRCVGWLCSRMVAHTEQERVTGPWMEDPCSAPPSPTCTLTLPLPLRVTFLHICHSGNGKREGGKEQCRHGKRSTWLTINCVATWRVRKTERERDQRSEEEGERE